MWALEMTLTWLFLCLLLFFLFLNLNDVLHTVWSYANPRLNFWLFWWLFFGEFNDASYFRIIQTLQMVRANIFKNFIELIFWSFSHRISFFICFFNHKDKIATWTVGALTQSWRITFAYLQNDFCRFCNCECLWN